MVNITEQQVKIRSDLIAHFKSKEPLICTPSGNNQLMIFEYGVLSRGWFWNSNRTVFTIFFQKGMVIETKESAYAKIGVILHDLLGYSHQYEEIAAIISKYYPKQLISRERDLPAGGY